jgi:signal transduction histidine kinase
MIHSGRFSSPAGTAELLTVVDVVSDALRPLAVRMANRRIVVDRQIPSNLQIWSDRQLLLETLRRLVQHAMERMPTGGEITITALENDWQTLIEVADEGPGVTERQPQEILDFLAASPRALEAVDLKEVHRTIRMQGGSLEILDCPEGGSAFTICLPRPARRAAA